MISLFSFLNLKNKVFIILNIYYKKKINFFFKILFVFMKNLIFSFKDFKEETKIIKNKYKYY